MDAQSFVSRVWKPEHEIVSKKGHKVAFYFSWVYGGLDFRAITVWESPNGTFTVGQPCVYRSSGGHLIRPVHVDPAVWACLIAEVARKNPLGLSVMEFTQRLGVYGQKTKALRDAIEGRSQAF